MRRPGGGLLSLTGHQCGLYPTNEVSESEGSRSSRLQGVRAGEREKGRKRGTRRRWQHQGPLASMITLPYQWELVLACCVSPLSLCVCVCAPTLRRASASCQNITSGWAAPHITTNHRRHHRRCWQTQIETGIDYSIGSSANKQHGTILPMRGAANQRPAMQATNARRRASISCVSLDFFNPGLAPPGARCRAPSRGACQLLANSARPANMCLVRGLLS